MMPLPRAARKGSPVISQFLVRLSVVGRGANLRQSDNRERASVTSDSA
jgi:hypothetical protein